MRARSSGRRVDVADEEVVEVGVRLDARPQGPVVPARLEGEPEPVVPGRRAAPLAFELFSQRDLEVVPASEPGQLLRGEVDLCIAEQEGRLADSRQVGAE